MTIALQFCAIIAACFSFVYVFFVIHEYGETHWLPSAATSRLAGFTCATFYAVAAQFKRYWKRVRFWLLASLFLVIHFIGYEYVLHLYPEWPLLWFAAVAFIEIPVISATITQVGGFAP